jgi:hypothetical protein
MIVEHIPEFLWVGLAVSAEKGTEPMVDDPIAGAPLEHAGTAGRARACSARFILVMVDRLVLRQHR